MQPAVVANLEKFKWAIKLKKTLKEIIQKCQGSGFELIMTELSKYGLQLNQEFGLKSLQYFPKCCKYCKKHKNVPVYLRILMNNEHDESIKRFTDIRKELKNLKLQPNGEDAKNQSNQQDQQQDKKKDKQQNNQQRQVQIIQQINQIIQSTDLFQIICNECFTTRRFLSFQQKKQFGILQQNDQDKESQINQNILMSEEEIAKIELNIEINQSSLQNILNKEQKKNLDQQIKKYKGEKSQLKRNLTKLQTELKEEKIDSYYRQERLMYLIPCYSPLNQNDLKQLKKRMISLLTQEFFSQQNILQKSLYQTCIHRYIKCDSCLDVWNKYQFQSIDNSQNNQLRNGLHGIRWASVPKNPKEAINITSYCQKCFLSRTSDETKESDYAADNFFLIKLLPEVSDYNYDPKLDDQKKYLKEQYKIENKCSHFILYAESLNYKRRDQYADEIKKRQDIRQEVDKELNKTQKNQLQDVENQQIFSHLNIFKWNTVINKVVNSVAKQVIQIFIPQGFIGRDSFSGCSLEQTIRNIDKIQLYNHPNILRIRGFIAKKAQNINKMMVSVTFFGERMITSLQNLLEIKQIKTKSTYLESLPIFWRMQIGLKIFTAVRFLHSLQYQYKDYEVNEMRK